MAAAVPRFASDIRVDGLAIEPEQSIMMTWAVVGAAPLGPDPDEVTVTTASTTVELAGRYSFWNTSAWKAGCSVMGVSSLRWVGQHGDGDVVLAARIEGQSHQRLSGCQRVGARGRLGQLGGVGPVPEQAVAADQDPTWPGWRKRTQGRDGIGGIRAQPAHQRARLRLRDLGRNRHAPRGVPRGDRVVDGEAGRLSVGVRQPVGPAVADPADRDRVRVDD